MRRIAGLGLALFVSACVAPQRATPPPIPRPVPTYAPVIPPSPPADWRDRSYTPGDWSYGRAAGAGASASSSSSEARYGTAGAAPVLTLACNRSSGQIRLAWRGGSAGPVTVRTTYGDVARQAQASGPESQILFAALDPLLDQIAYSRGRFMLVAGELALVAPAWPEISRVIEDCR